MSGKNAIVFLEGRASFPALAVKAKAFEEGQEGSYELTLIMPKDGKSAKEAEAAVNAIAKSVGAKLDKLGADRICLKDGDDYQYESHHGNIIVKAKSKRPPALLDTDKMRLDVAGRKAMAAKAGTPLDAEAIEAVKAEIEEKFYAGCQVKAKVQIWWQDNKFGKRFNASLQAVQFIRDDDPYGSGGNPEEGFDAILDGEAGGEDLPF